jgi:catechol 2,3-dioxygenase-like lactoylglutathione lyase family enzyme
MSGFKISQLDHIVLNVADIERSLQFYTGVMGLKANASTNSALARPAFRPCASTATPSSICFQSRDSRVGRVMEKKQRAI